VIDDLRLTILRSCYTVYRSIELFTVIIMQIVLWILRTSLQGVGALGGGLICASSSQVRRRRFYREGNAYVDAQAITLILGTSYPPVAKRKAVAQPKCQVGGGAGWRPGVSSKEGGIR
jgi:hypothetical protein